MTNQEIFTFSREQNATWECTLAQMGRVAQVPQQPCPWPADPRSRYWGWVLWFLSPWGQCQANGALEPPPLRPTRPTSGILSPKLGATQVFFTFPRATLDSSKKPWRSPSQSVLASIVWKPRTSTDGAGGNRGRELREMRGFGLDYWTRVETLREAPPSPPSIFQERGDPELKVTKSKAGVTPAPLGLCDSRGEGVQDWEAETETTLHSHHHQDRAGR